MSERHVSTLNGFHLKQIPNGWVVGRFEVLEALRIPHLVTTRLGPDVRQARYCTYRVATQIASMLGLTDAAYLNQVHGDQVLIVQQPGLAGSADGLCTSTKGLMLAAKSGDCPIVLVAEKTARAVGFAHASWRATVAGVVPRLITQMGKLCCEPKDLIACICPSIGPDCYKVGQEVLLAAKAGIGPEAVRFFRPDTDGFFFDLWSANADALARSGVIQIHLAGLCSACRNDLFPSHRRDGTQAGRFLACIGLPD